MPNKPAFGRLEKIIAAGLFVAFASIVTLTVNNYKRQYKIDHPRGIATYTSQPGDSLPGIYEAWGKRDIPDKKAWLAKVLEYNPNLNEHGPIEPGTTISLFYF